MFYTSLDQNAAAGRGAFTFSARARAALHRYSWPGNVRELANLIERLSILNNGGIVDLPQLPPRYRPVEVAGAAVVFLFPILQVCALPVIEFAKLFFIGYKTKFMMLIV